MSKALSFGLVSRVSQLPDILSSKLKETELQIRNLEHRFGIKFHETKLLDIKFPQESFLLRVHKR